MSKKEDIEFGTAKEKSEMGILKKTFGEDLQKTSHYHYFDYQCPNCFVELKSRRTPKDHYPDTMVGKNKIDRASQSERPVFFCFSFTDGLYYWKYNKEDIANGNVEFRTGGRNDRGRPEYSNYAFIKTRILNRIC